MELAHLHLILNHIPIVGLPIALIFLLHGLRTHQVATQRFALWVLVGLAVGVLPVYYTGEPAEHLVKHLPGVAENLIENHEEAAEVSLILTLVTGAAAVVALWLQRRLKGGAMILVVLALAAGSVLSLVYTGNLGGKIRHTELRSGAGTGGGGEGAATPALSHEKDGDDDDD